MSEAITISTPVATNSSFTVPVPPIVNEAVEDVLPKNPTGQQAKEYFERQKLKAQGKVPPKVHEKPVDRFMEKENPEPKKEPTEEQKEIARKFKVKINGAEQEVDEGELIRGYSHQQAANKAMQEGKRALKQAEQLVNMLKDKGQLFNVIKELGHDPRQLTEEYLVKQLEEEMLDPKDRAIRERDQRIKDFEEKEKRELEKISQQRHEELKQKFAQQYNQEFVQALQAEKLPPTKVTVAEMARYISRASKVGFEMSATEAAQLVRQDIVDRQKRIIADADPETLINLFGKEVVDKIRQHDLAKLKSPERFLQSPVEQGEPRKQVNNQKTTRQEWLRQRRGLA